MKPCCNPSGRSHPRRKGGRTERVLPEHITWYRRIYPNFDWSDEKYLCTCCSFDIKKQVDMLKTVSLVAKGVNTARKSTARKTSQPGHRSSPAETPPSWMEFPDVSSVYQPSAPALPSDLSSRVGSPMELSERSSAGSDEGDEGPSTSTAAVSMMETSSTESSPKTSGATSSVLPGPSTLASSHSSTTHAVSTLAPTLLELEAEEGLNTTLNTLAITPIHQHGPASKNLIQQTYLKAQKALKDKFETYTKKMFDFSPPPKQKTCFFCTSLLAEFSIRFPLLTSKLDKYKLLTSIPKRFTVTEVQQKIGVTSYMMSKANKLRNSVGAFSAPTFKYGHPLPPDVVDLVKKFYLSTDNSRISPGIRDTIYIRDANGEKQSVQKQRILSNLNELYLSFTQKYKKVEISESKFAVLRPKNCVWPGRKGFHNTCVCEIHQNFDFMLQALGTNEKLTSFLDKVVCTPATTECFNRMCSDCPKTHYIRGLFSNIVEEEDVEFMQWQHTDATDIKKVSMSSEEFMDEFEANVPKIIEHDYVYRMQRDFIKHLREVTIRETKGITIHVDFAQNYSFIIQDAVQGFHWSNKQATIHPFVVHWWCSTTNRLAFRTYCVISNDMAHDADTFHAFRVQVMEQIKDDFDFLDLQKVYYVSDGAAGQYKNYKNFANLLQHVEDFGIPAEWHFTATAHGKSTCDAISGVVKSATRIESLKPGRFITTAEEMANFCIRKLESDTLRIMYIDKAYVDGKRADLAQRYSTFKTIPGSRKYHMFAPVQNVMEMRMTSTSTSVIKYNFVLGETTLFSFETLQIGTFYAFQASANYQIGMVSDFIQNEGEVLMQVLKLNRRNGKMEYPSPFLFLEVPVRDIFTQVSDPVTKDGKIFLFIENELEAVKASYKTFCINKKRGC